jgi:hypothetical protein
MLTIDEIWVLFLIGTSIIVTPLFLIRKAEKRVTLLFIGENR